MNIYEYKTVELKRKGLFKFSKTRAADIDALLNAQALQGWRLHHTIAPSYGFGETEKFLLVFERLKADPGVVPGDNQNRALEERAT